MGVSLIISMAVKLHTRLKYYELSFILSIVLIVLYSRTFNLLVSRFIRAIKGFEV